MISDLIKRMQNIKFKSQFFVENSDFKYLPIIQVLRCFSIKSSLSMQIMPPISFLSIIRFENRSSFWSSTAVVCLCFFLLRLPTKPCYCDVTMHAQYFFVGREVKNSYESVLPVTKKKGKEKGKWTIGLRMKNGHANTQFLCEYLTWFCRESK